MNGKILVTGSAVFIGRALMWRLAGPAIPYDVADDRHQDVRTLAVLHAMRRCEAVIHLAGETGARDCNAHPGRAQSTNDTGTFNVLRAANAARIGRGIVASAASTTAPPPSSAVPQSTAGAYTLRSSGARWRVSCGGLR